MVVVIFNSDISNPSKSAKNSEFQKQNLLCVLWFKLSLTGFDLDQRESGRISLKAGAITRFGFQATISTWSTTRVYAVEFNWLAIGA
jgi:hypothetical protein